MAVYNSLTLEEVSYSVENNTSEVRMLWTSTQTGQSHNLNTRTGYYVFNGTNGSVQYTLPANTTVTIFDETFTVSHNSDGTGSVSASTWMDTRISAGEISKEASLTLTTIPRASSVSCSPAFIGSDATITINRASANFTHTLTYNFFGLTGTIAVKTTQTSVKFTLPETFYAKIPNLNFGKGVIECTTYNGDTEIGTSVCQMQAICNKEECLPSIVVESYDSNSTTVALTGNKSTFVKYYSNVAVTAHAVAKNSATIKSQSITIGSTTINSGSGTINSVTDGEIKATVTDSRRFTNHTISIHTLVPYVKLTCLLQAGAASTSGVAQLQVSGNYWNGNFGATANTLTVQYRFKDQDGAFSNWITSSAAVTKSYNTYDTTISISGLDYTKAYTFQARVIDKLATVASKEQTRKTQPIFDWGVSDGVADFNINGTLKINNVNIFDMIYPVDSIYISINNVNPSTLFGGTWERIKDTFLLAAGDTYAGGSTGGEATHALTWNEMPGHYHEGLYYSYQDTKNLVTLNGGTASYHIPWGSSDHPGDYGAGSGATELITGSAGGGAAHNNMPPYLAVYIWKRTA